MSRCHKPGSNPRQASFVSDSCGAAFFSADVFGGFVAVSVAIFFRERVPDSQLAKNKVRSQTCFARFFILRAHVLASFGERLDRGIEVNAMP